MKKIILATTLLVALSTASFADGKDVKLLGDLKTAFENASHLRWTTTDDYRKTSFVFNDQQVNVFLNPDNSDLIGFSRHFPVNDLPQSALDRIEKKYKGWTVVETIIFIFADGRINYYAKVNKGKNNIALEISQKGSVNYFAKMPS